MTKKLCLIMIVESILSEKFFFFFKLYLSENLLIFFLKNIYIYFLFTFAYYKDSIMDHLIYLYYFLKFFIPYIFKNSFIKNTSSIEHTLYVSLCKNDHKIKIK